MVSKCGCEQVNVADYRLWLLSFYMTATCLNPLVLSVFIPPDPVFVQIQQIPDSAERNDDKLYFFFREMTLDSSGAESPSVVSRVGRVCLVSQTCCTDWSNLRRLCFTLVMLSL